MDFKKFALAHFKGVTLSVLITFGVILLLAIAVQTTSLNATAISVINQTLKVISIFIGLAIALKSVSKRAWFHGLVFGVIYATVSLLIISIIDSSFLITDGFIFETIFAGTIGLVSAMLLRLRKREA